MPLLINSSTTCIRKLSLLLCRNFLDCVCLAVWSFQQMSGWLKTPMRTRPVTVRLLSAACRRPHRLPFPGQVACSTHPKQCHPYFLPISSQLILHPPPGRAQYIPVAPSHTKQLCRLILLACPS